MSPEREAELVEESNRLRAEVGRLRRLDHARQEGIEALRAENDSLRHRLAGLARPRRPGPGARWRPWRQT